MKIVVDESVSYGVTSHEEIDLIKWFFDSYSVLDFKGRLVSISKERVKVR